VKKGNPKLEPDDLVNMVAMALRQGREPLARKLAGSLKLDINDVLCMSRMAWGDGNKALGDSLQAHAMSPKAKKPGKYGGPEAQARKKAWVSRMKQWL